MNNVSTSRTLAVSLLLLVLPGVSEADGLEEKRAEATVSVDCERGDSIAKALAKKADELVIEIRGVCEESVRIARAKVTLRGSDPEVDGIRGDGASPNTVLLEPGVFEIRLEKLTLHGPPPEIGGFALGMAGFSVAVVDCHIEGTRGGVIVNGFGGFEDTTIRSRDGGIALLVGSGSGSGCTRCTIDDDGAQGTGISVSRSATFRMTDGVVEARTALRVTDGGFFSLDGDAELRAVADAAGRGLAVSLDRGGNVRLSDAQLVGPVNVNDKSILSLAGVEQTIPEAFTARNRIGNDSFLRAVGATRLDGGLDVTEFSNAYLEEATSLGGNLLCDASADAFCTGPVAAVGSSCARCSVP